MTIIETAVYADLDSNLRLLYEYCWEWVSINYKHSTRNATFKYSVLHIVYGFNILLIVYITRKNILRRFWGYRLHLEESVWLTHCIGMEIDNLKINSNLHITWLCVVSLDTVHFPGSSLVKSIEMLSSLFVSNWNRVSSLSTMSSALNCSSTIYIRKRCEIVIHPI